MSDVTPNSNFSNREEDKSIVTPFAFGVHDSLLGRRLASPVRRLFAVLLDLVCIGLLTLLPSLWLSAIILCIALRSLYSLRNQPTKKWPRALLIILAVFTSLTIVLSLLTEHFLSDKQYQLILSKPGVSEQELAEADLQLEYKNASIAEDYTLVIGSLKNVRGDLLCEKGRQCGPDFFAALTRDLIEKGYQYEDANTLYVGVRDFLAENQRLDDSMVNTELAHNLYQQRFDDANTLDPRQGTSNSLIDWVNGILGDLGLSFGWAAVYFSCLTAWWHGQTLGKRLLGIKVVRIDGKSIDLWESIGRYGGYSAGLGTGLLGFLQIYWDVNRQGIQDKISETLVIRL